MEKQENSKPCQFDQAENFMDLPPRGWKNNDFPRRFRGNCKKHEKTRIYPKKKKKSDDLTFPLWLYKDGTHYLLPYYYR